MPYSSKARPTTIYSGSSEHTLFHADSRQCRYASRFDLVLTSPPYFHPSRKSTKHGIGFVGDIQQYARTVSEALLSASNSAIGRKLCFVKTDVWHKGALIPVGYELMRACLNRGLRLRAHWVWKRLSAFSPYAPTFSNIFIFADDFQRPHCTGLITPTAVHLRGQPSSYVPELFRELISLLTKPRDLILDPFMGLGGVIEAAATRNRRSVGVELSAAQFQMAASRLSMLRGSVRGTSTCQLELER